MKILFTIYDLQNYGGTETFTYSIVKELINEGHMVFCFSSKLGKTADRLKDIGAFVTDDMDSLPHDIDVIHAQHRMESLLAYIKFPNTPMIYTCHGIIPWQEQPGFFPTISKYVAVSEEISEHLNQKYKIPTDKIEIIRNGVDLQRFKPQSDFRKKPRNLLLLSNRYTEEVKIVLEETCTNLELELNVIGQSSKAVWDVDKEIMEADIVVSLGRGVLEAMASGKLAVVYDYNGGDGVVTPDNYKEVRKRNFSGRTNKIKYDSNRLSQEIISNYNRNNIDQNLSIIKEYHDITKIAKLFESLYIQALENNDRSITFDQESIGIINSNYKNIGKELIQKEMNTRYLTELNLEKDNKIAEQNNIIIQLDNRINNANVKIKNLEEVNQEYFKQLVKFTDQVNEISKSLVLKQEEIVHLSDHINRKEKRNFELNNEILMIKDQIIELTKHIQKDEEVINEKNKSIQYLTELLEEKQNEISQKENNTKYLFELNQEKVNELNLIYNSKSWKLVTKYRINKERMKKAIKNPRWLMQRLLGKKTFPISEKQQSIVKIHSDAEPLVSVVIPVYDRTDVLIESIESILKQTYRNIELIIVCDGSPQPTLDIVKKYENYPQVRTFYFFNNSGNAVRGRNKAIIEASGKYLAFQDSDDVAEPNRIETSIKYIEEFNADIVYGGWRAKIDGSRKIDIENNQEIHSPDCDYDMLLKICVPCQSTVMARLDALRAVGGLKSSMKYREDHELWLRLAYKGYKFKSIPHVLTNLRLHENNLELQFKETDDYWFKLMLEEHKVVTKLKPKIAYVIPGCGISGGIAVICQHANRLLKRGYDVVLITEDDKKAIDWFPGQQVQIFSLQEAPNNLDIVIATGWSTAYTIANIPSKRKIYFVQSDESRFYPKDSRDYFSALESYNFNYEYMTEAKWIQQWLSNSFGKSAHYVPNGLDETIIYQTPPLAEKQSRIRVLLEGPIDIPFKGMEDAFAAVKDLDCEVWCISSAGRPKADWRCDRFFEKVPMEHMKQIYSSCDILLKMSRVEGFFGPPLEMMACGGTCVVGEVTGYDEYIVNEYNALVVPLGDVEGAKKAVKRLIDEKELRTKLIENGRKTAEQWRWEPTIDILEKIICERSYEENINN